MPELLEGTSSPASEPAPVAQTPDSSAGLSTSASSPSPSPASQPASSAPAAQPGFRDLLSKFGASDVASQFKDDEALAHHFLQTQAELKRSQELARYGEQVQPYWSEFQKWQAQQQQAAQAAALQSQQQPWWSEYWKPPEFDPAWEKQIHKDAAGNLVPAPGAPLDVVQKYNQYLSFRTTQADKLMKNPFEFFEKPMVALAQRVAQQVVQQRFAGHEDQQFATGFIQQNSSWLHKRDAQGQPIIDPQTRQPALSDDGVRFKNYVVQAEKELGIRDIRAMQQYALGMVQRDYALSQLASQTQPQTPSVAPSVAQGEAAKQQFLQGARKPNTSGSVQPANGNGTPPAQNPGLSLNQRLRKNLAESGVTDKDVQ